MKVSGHAVLSAPVEQVWQALLDPAVLVRTIPGCEQLVSTGENRYAVTLSAGVASIKGTYTGTVELADLHEATSLLLKAAGAGAPGTVGADVRVTFADTGEGRTTLGYDADAVVGGMIAGVGQRMLTSASKRMAGEFFAAVDRVLTGTELAVAPVHGAQPSTATGDGQVFTAPAAAGRPGSRDFAQGLVVGGCLALAGVLLGGLIGRRRS
ncbi:MAG: SRPBCC family protein [Nocardioidaceae bacterium]